MCLHIDLEQTKKFREKYKDQKEITCYKVITKKFKSIYFSDCKYHVGINKSNRKNIEQNTEDDWYFGCDNAEIKKGIHVFTNKKYAKQYAYDQKEIIIPVLCKLSDLVACGKNQDAVFMKIRIKKGALKL